MTLSVVGIEIKRHLRYDAVERIDEHEMEDGLCLRVEADLHELRRFVRVRSDTQARQITINHQLYIRVTRVRTA